MVAPGPGRGIFCQPMTRRTLSGRRAAVAHLPGVLRAADSDDDIRTAR